ncbi:MAG: hypothetical protein ACI3YH_05425 [Eubacteriales bacterium]
MKCLLLVALCLLLTSCSYFGATEEILISSPYELTVKTIETYRTVPTTTPTAATTDESGSPAETTTGTAATTEAPMPEVTELILSKSTKKIHYYDFCSYAAKIKDQNRATASVEHEDQLLAEGYTVCSWCAKKRGE